MTAQSISVYQNLCIVGELIFCRLIATTVCTQCYYYYSNNNYHRLPLFSRLEKRDLINLRLTQLKPDFLLVHRVSNMVSTKQR